jgi:uncharacterized SAM-binding protein YcdF (DUF218 family)
MQALLSPLGLALLACLMELVPHARIPRLVRWAVRAVGLICVILMTPLGANALVYQIESWVSTAEVCQADHWPEDVVLLSGGLLRKPEDAADFSALTTSSLRRLSLAVRAVPQHPEARLIVSGGGPHALKESEVLAALAVRLGVPPDRLIQETVSSSTMGSAQALAQQQTRLSLAHRVGVITSALHMPRAILAFEQAGFEPCAIPAYSSFLASGGALGYHLPQSSALQKSEDALHELFGLLAYRWRAPPTATDPPP